MLKVNKKLLPIIGGVMIVIAQSFPVSAGVPVTNTVSDGLRAIEAAKNLAEQVSQLNELKAQLEQAQQSFEAVTGKRGLGGVLDSQEIKGALDNNWGEVYSNGSGLAGLVDMLDSRKLDPTVKKSTIQAEINNSRKEQFASSQIIYQKAYTAAAQRVSQIDGLMALIDVTNDPKAIAELQARIAIEQSQISNDANKLAILSKLQKAQSDFLLDKQTQLEDRAFDPSNTLVPTIKQD